MKHILSVAMKQAFLIIVFSIAHFNSFSQERVNRAKLTYSTVSDSLTNSTGWAYNTTSGEWVDYENIICDDKKYKEEYKALQGEFQMSRIAQSFNVIETKSFTMNGKTLYVLLIHKWAGAYKYPNLMKDWYTFKKTIGYIFTESEYKKLYSIEKTIELKTKIKIEMGSKYETYNESAFLDLLQTEVSKNDPYSLEYTFPVMKSTEGLIRYLLPDMSLMEYDFKKNYLECSLSAFNKIIIRK